MSTYTLCTNKNKVMSRTLIKVLGVYQKNQENKVRKLKPFMQFDR
jgi:hypothetical protein